VLGHLLDCCLSMGVVVGTDSHSSSPQNGQYFILSARNASRILRRFWHTNAS